MSDITIDVEFLAGTSINQAISEAKQKAIQWDVAYVCFSFNGVSMSVGQNADVDEGISQWEAALGSRFKSAIVN